MKKPRLILRIGTLGPSGDVSCTETDRESTVQRALEGVLRAIDVEVYAVHSSDRHDLYPAQNPKSSRWYTHIASRLFFRRDLWRFDKSGMNASVFCEDQPLVQLLVSRDNVRNPQTCQIHTGPTDHDCEWKTLGIEPVSDSSRHYRQALRHHSDLIIAYIDELGSQDDRDQVIDEIEATLRDGIPVIVIKANSSEKSSSIHVFAQIDQIRSRLNKQADPSEWRPQIKKLVWEILAFPDHKFEWSKHGGWIPTTFHPRAAYHRFLDWESNSNPLLARIWHVTHAWFIVCGRRYAVSRIDPQDYDKKGIENDRLEQDQNQLRKRFRELVYWDEICSLFSRNTNSGSLSPAAQKLADDDSYEQCYGTVRKRVTGNGYSGLFGAMYRGALLSSFLMATIAVVLAIVTVMILLVRNDKESMHGCLVFVAAIEFVIILLMFALSACAKTEGWNHIYSQSRILAEALRQMEFLGPLGIHTPLARFPHYLRGDDQAPSPKDLWTTWYFRALCRMAPLRLSSSFGQDHSSLRDWIIRDWIDRQIEYHETKENSQQAVHHWFENATTCVFLLVLVAAGIHLWEELFHTEGLRNLCIGTCIIGPAIIAATHGFASQLDVTRLKQRSASMVAILQEQKRRLLSMEFDENDHEAEGWQLASEVLATASLMMDEAAGWSIIQTNSDVHAG